MSIAYLDLPFRATSKLNGQELLVFAIFHDPDPTTFTSPKLLCIQEDGDLTEMAIGEVNFSWRYDDRRNVWVDATLPPEEIE